MKEYQKPEVTVVNFTSEATATDIGTPGIESSSVVRPGG